MYNLDILRYKQIFYKAFPETTFVGTSLVKFINLLKYQIIQWLKRRVHKKGQEPSIGIS
jgi:hypothetical protein